MSMRRIAAAACALVPVLLLALAALACTKQEEHLMCDACIERDGQMYCGRSDILIDLEPDTTEDTGKLAAGKAACVEFAARKGGGYAGPPYEKALAECVAGVKPSDLRRARCENRVVGKRWNPKDGV